MVSIWLQTLSIAMAGSVALLGVLHVSSPRNRSSRKGLGNRLVRRIKSRLAAAKGQSKPNDADSDREFEFDGRHLLASYSACNPAAIRDIAGLTAAFHAAVRASGATLLHAVEHTFPPHGMTAVAVLSESHASIHTYPEHESCFVDIFTCGNTCNVEAFDETLRDFLRPKKQSRRIIRRHEKMVDESHGSADAAA
ncbi:MAG TPA: adenosylmethionine decarboxylase [Pirellulales bacterium]|nr:adenosylmethionine decarboxylase [Pirellulales bacterium]